MWSDDGEEGVDGLGHSHGKVLLAFRIEVLWGWIAEGIGLGVLCWAWE